ncbi:MAG: tyrosine/phenylalanine carboxypeptidase domain-containing protein [Ferruginibacter sp.]
MLNTLLVETISSTYKKGKSIRRKMPHNSKLVIDQKLPYLCVYRFIESPDPFIASLLKTQGAYLICEASLDITGLLETIEQVSVNEFKSFMLLEIWPDTSNNSSKTITINYPGEDVPATVKAMDKGFSEMKDLLDGINVHLSPTGKRSSEKFEPLVSLEKLKKTGTLLIGISIPPLFTDKTTNLDYPLFFRRVRRKFADVIKLAAYEFVRVQADNKFEHYLMLGKTRLDNLVRSADKRLAVISEKMDFILRVTPVNTAAQWERFKEKKYTVLPQFTYRLISLDPELEKRKLFNIPLENIEHPTLAFLLRDKRMELEKQLLMLEERGTKKFLHTSKSIYGDLDKELIDTATVLLEDSLPNEEKEYESLDAKAFAARAEKELAIYRPHFPGLNLRVTIKENVTGLIVSGEELSVGMGLNMSEGRVNALIQHEVGTHMLTYGNGHMQPLNLMYAGFAGYEQIQEGLAVLSEFFVDGLNRNRLKLLAARVMAVHSLEQGADFIETFRLLSDDFSFSKHTAFNVSMRVHRGGGYTKDAIYLKGLLELLSFIKTGGNINQLYAGKYALEHLPLIQELTHLGILKKPLLPAWLHAEATKEKIEILKKGIELKTLITSS